MRYQQLGETDIIASVVGLGGCQFGTWNSDITIDDGAKLVRAAMDRGINYFDTAPWYGYNSGSSEKTFGAAFWGLPRSSFYIATKVGRYEQDILKMFDFRAERVESSVKQSLEYLGLDYIDVVQVHDFEYAEDINQILTETLPALDRLKQRGLIRYIGLGTFDLPKIKFVIENSPVKIDTVLNHTCLTLIDQQLLEYIPWLKERGVGILNASALAHGLLNGMVRPWLRKTNADLLAACRRSWQLCSDGGFDLARLANGFSAHEGQINGVDVMLTGPENPEQLDANISVIVDGLNESELSMAYRLRDDVFGSLVYRNWGNDDAKDYFRKIKEARNKIN